MASISSKYLYLILIVTCVITFVSSQKPGGLNDERQADDEIRKVIARVHGDVERMAKEEYESIEPITYRKQIVAGANYFVKAHAIGKDGSKSHIHLRIYRPFRGPLELSAIRAHQDVNKPLEYFD